MLEWLTEISNLNYLSLPEVVLRMTLAAVFAMVLGLERYSKGKPIDYRAFVIISLTSCVLAILSQEIYFDYANADGVVSMDLAKIIAGVLTGIGFLGAGAIIKQKDGDVVGTATGASIWASGALGLTIGFGFYVLGVLMFLFVAAILMLSGRLIRAAKSGMAD